MDLIERLHVLGLHPHLYTDYITGGDEEFVLELTYHMPYMFAIRAKSWPDIRDRATRFADVYEAYVSNAPRCHHA